MNDIIQNYRIQILLVLILIILSISAYIVYDVVVNQISHYVSVLLVEKNGQQYELMIRKNDNATIFREGENKKIISTVPRTGKERLAFPDLNDVVAENTLEGLLPISSLTWQLSFSDSFKYIKYMTDIEGYNIEMYASTPQYIELFLSKDGGYTRVIVFRDSIMIGELFEGVNLPDGEDYFNSFDILGINKVD